MLDHLIASFTCIKWKGKIYNVSPIYVTDDDISFSLEPENEEFKNVLIQKIRSNKFENLSTYLTGRNYCWFSDDPNKGEV